MFCDHNEHVKGIFLVMEMGVGFCFEEERDLVKMNGHACFLVLSSFGKRNQNNNNKQLNMICTVAQRQ